MSMSRRLSGSFSNEKSNEYAEENVELSADPRKLKLENEHYRQEIYALHRKLDLNETILKELQEANEALERTVTRQCVEKKAALLEADEKHRAAREEYEHQIEHLEAYLAQKELENEQFRERLRSREKVLNVKSESALIVGDHESDVASLEQRLQETYSLLRTEEEKRVRAEETIEHLENRCEDLERVSSITKERLSEVTEALENVREELACTRAELHSQNHEPDSDSRKGNSLFAEVEDRRRCALDKMNLLREKYLEAKRAYAAKATQVNVLMAERTAMLRKWDNDAIDTLAESDELTRMYKSRICELETKLKSEIKKKVDGIDAALTADATYGYFQSLLVAKKREAEELRAKLEELSTRILVQEEAKLRATKQLRYWRYKAMTLEAEVLALRTNKETVLNTESIATLDIFDKPLNETNETNEAQETAVSVAILDSKARSSTHLPVTPQESAGEYTTTLLAEANDPRPNFESKAMDASRSRISEEGAVFRSEITQKILRFTEETESKDTSAVPEKLRASKHHEYAIVYLPAE